MDSFGNRLRQARLGRSLSLHEVGSLIQIGANYLGALEDENILLLPGKAYALGFCKKYAQFLDIDFQQSVSELKQLYLQAESEDDLIIFKEEKALKKQNLLIGLSLFFAVVLILTGLIYYIPTKENSKTLVMKAKESSQNQQKQQKPTLPQPQTKQKQENIIPLKPAIETPASTGLKLQAVSDKSWVLVNVDGKEIFKGIIYPGEFKTFSGKLIKIKLGNAGAVDITYNNTHIGYLGSMHQVKSKTFPDNTEVMQ